MQDYGMNGSIKEIEVYAKDNNIPIMLSDGIDYLCNYIRNNNIKSILEIGSAIGYSAIRMALVNKDIHITTIEKDEIRYNEAIKNINKFDLIKQITIYNMDAIEYEDNNKYDLIFIDAAKGKNILFFEKFENNLNKNGVIITDNLSFHGLVEDSNLIETKNQRKIVDKIKLYIDYLNNNLNYRTIYYSVGDKLSISKQITTK